jgi:hypothetical protein
LPLFTPLKFAGEPLSHAGTPWKREISDESNNVCDTCKQSHGAQQECFSLFQAHLAHLGNEWCRTNNLREWEKTVTWDEKESGQNINGKYFSDDEPKIRFEI